MDLSQFVLLIALVYAVVDTFKWLFVPDPNITLKWGTVPVWKLVTLVLSAAVFPLAGLDLFAKVGFVFPVPYVGGVLTGVIAARGANVLHDVLALPTQFLNKPA